MLSRPDTIVTAVNNWLARFEQALAASNGDLFNGLFHTDSHWRDILALTWRIQTIEGSDAIAQALRAHAGRAKPTGFKIAANRTPPRLATRAGTEAIEAIFTFEVADGPGSGALRLTKDPHQAEDLVQDTFARAFAASHTAYCTVQWPQVFFCSNSSGVYCASWMTRSASSTRSSAPCVAPNEPS